MGVARVICGQIKEHIWTNQGAYMDKSRSIYGQIKEHIWTNQGAYMDKILT